MTDYSIDRYETIGLCLPGGTSYSIISASDHLLSVAPESFSKIALALLAAYNSTYDQSLVRNITSMKEKPHGFADGFTVGTNQLVGGTSGGTENMIMEAAVHAMCESC